MSHAFPSSSPSPLFFLLLSLLTPGSWLLPSPALAQITPDGTVGTTVTGGPNFTIDGGTRPSGGPNLFHSFSQFSVPTGGAAIFNNAPDVVNIISRVTGGSISNIDGLIRANGTANLFLINPAGIVFGPNASLNIGGSFIGSTAHSLKFSDGTEFSAVNPAPPLLTINVPIGLQMGPNPGTISVRANPGLAISPGQTLALIGGDVTFANGRITAPSARVEFGSVSNGMVGISPSWQFDYATSQPTHSVSLTQGSQIVTSGATRGGNVRVFGETLFVTTGSRIDTSSISSQPAGNIDVQTTKEILLDPGTTTGSTGLLAEVKSGATGQGGTLTLRTQSVRMLNGGFLSADTSGNANAGNINITADTLLVDTGTSNSTELLRTKVNAGARGNGGAITLQTNQLQLLNGAQVVVNTNGLGNSGQIKVIANNIKIDGIKNPTIGTSVSGLFARTNASGKGNAGEITVQTDQLQLFNGGRISTTTLGVGNAGNVNITACSILSDTGTSTIQNLIQSNVARGAIGNGGTVNIEADNVRFLNGSQIDVSTSAKGNGGNVQIVAKDIELAGRNINDVFSSAIVAAIQDTGNGKGGNVNIETDRLHILNGARINVSAEGIGDAGNLNITAQTVEIDRQTSPRATGLFSQVVGAASTFSQTRLRIGSGTGGEINLHTQRLSLANGGEISAVAAGNGDAGNISITADQIALQTGSTIATETFASGRGGDLNVVARTLDLDTSSSISSASYGSGLTGNLNLQAQHTTLLNGSQITTRSTGTGDGGTVNLTGGSLTLRNNAAINASTASGNGGNINLNLSGLLYLRDLSQISAEAGGTGNGGNIDIRALFVVGWGNSDIIANAVKGRGGNINITTQGIFWLKFRPFLTPRNDITASSQFGLNGSVQINTLSLDPSSGLVQLPATLEDASRKMASLCQQTEGSSFVYTGRGGLPENPLERFEGLHPWEDLRDLSAFQHQPPVAPPQRQSAEPTVIVEANAIRRNPDGTVELVAEGESGVTPGFVSCRWQQE